MEANSLIFAIIFTVILVIGAIFVSKKLKGKNSSPELYNLKDYKAKIKALYDERKQIDEEILENYDNLKLLETEIKNELHHKDNQEIIHIIAKIYDTKTTDTDNTEDPKNDKA